MNSFVNKFSGAGLVLAFLVLLCLGATRVQAGDATAVVKIHLPGYSTSSLPFLIADELGFYREQGIRIEFTRIQTGSGIQALVAGALDASQIVGPTTLAAILGGAPLKVVTVFNDKPTFKSTSRNSSGALPISREPGLAVPRPAAPTIGY